jgi:hypothetical protein
MTGRNVRRLVAQGIITPLAPGQGRRAGLYDALAAARAVIRHKSTVTPRDRLALEQARLTRLRYRKEKRELLERAAVIRAGVAVAKTLSAYLTSLPSRMVKDGLVPAEHEAAIDGYIRERLDERSRLADEGYLSGDEDGHGAA